MAKQKNGLLAYRRYAELKDVTVRTLDRWVDLGILEKPVKIRGRKYLPEDAEPKHGERAGTQI